MKKFTLIELLVVIAIIGILSSMLLPSLTEARNKGVIAVCISNLKQIGIANMSYVSDENDSLPVGLWDATGTGVATNGSMPEGYEHGLMPHIGYTGKVFECPGFERSNYAGSYGRRAIKDSEGVDHFAFRTYRPNNFRYYNSPAGSDNRWKNGLIKFNYGMKLSIVASDTVLDGDYIRGFSYGTFGTEGYWDRRGASFGTHQNKVSNLLFVDGSVRIYKVRQYLSNPGLIFGSSSTFNFEGTSNNYGLFAANMAPSGTFWTVVDD